MKYRTIVADPPWEHDDGYATLPGSVLKHYRGGSIPRKPLPYKALTVEQICALPVRDLADPSGARLFLWTTNRFLPASFEVIRSWGFAYRQTAVWFKQGNPSPFGGHLAPNHAEFLMIAVHGKPPVLARWKSSVVAINVGAHSEKPERFLDLIEQSSPGPYLELFARTQRLGWDSWGNECLQHVEIALPQNPRSV